MEQRKFPKRMEECGNNRHMFSRKNTAITSKPRLDIWIKGTKIEQVRKHKSKNRKKLTSSNA
jgi:hypothetical protein